MLASRDRELQGFDTMGKRIEKEWSSTRLGSVAEVGSEAAKTIPKTALSLHRRKWTLALPAQGMRSEEFFNLLLLSLRHSPLLLIQRVHLYYVVGTKNI